MREETGINYLARSRVCVLVCTFYIYIFSTRGLGVKRIARRS